MQTQVGQIKQFLEAVYTRRRLFIVVAASVALIAVIASFFVPKRYEAKSTVFIERNVINSLMEGITVSPSMDDRIRVLSYYMVSRDMVTRTLKRLDMDADPRYATAEDFENLVKKCQAQTAISVKGKDLFFVSLIDPEPTFARDYINTLVNIYVEENLADKREESYGANRFITEQVTFYKQKLDEIDAKILNFRRETGIYSTVSEPAIMAQIAKDEEILTEIKSQKNETSATIETIRQQLAMLRDRSQLGYSAPLIEQLQLKVKELLLVYNDQYPTVIKLREQIEELQKRKQGDQPSAAGGGKDNFNPVEDPIYVDLKMRMNAAQSDLNALLAKEKDLTASVSANQALLRNFPEDKKTLNDLERERAMQAAVYEQLLQRVSVSEVSKQMEVSDKATSFRIVDPAILPAEPVGITRLLMMLIGILGGVAVGLGAVYTAEHLDDSIDGTQSLRDLGVTVLAEIPYIWSESETRMVKKKDRAVLSFAVICALMIGAMMLHDLLGMSFIDRVVADLNIISNLS